MILLCVSLLLGLRAAQLLGVAPLLFDWEFIQLGSLALEVEAGTTQISQIWRRPEGWTYMNHAQGTLLPIAGTALLTPVFGASVWALHATSVIPEAIAAACLLTLIWRRSRSRRLVLAAAFCWAFVPRGAVVWQMLPFGNHTEFLWIPLALALLFDIRQKSSFDSNAVALGMTLLLGFGFVAYRGVAAALAAVAITLVLTQGLRGVRRAVAILVGASFLVFWLLDGFVKPEQWQELFVREFLFGAPVVEPDPWGHRAVRFLRRLPSAPLHGSVSGLYHGVLGVANLVALGLLLRGRIPTPPQTGIAAPAESNGRPAALVFLVIWALVACFVTLAGDARYDQYFIQPFYALLAVTLLLPTLVRSGAWLRRGALCSVLLLGTLGAAEGVEMIRPSAWEANIDYRGLRLWGQFQMTSLDEDDIPYWNQIAGSTQFNHFAGQGFPRTEHCQPSLRMGSGETIPEPGSNRCSCWPEGEFAVHLQQRLEEYAELPVNQLAVGAWIGCNRDQKAMTAAMRGLAPSIAERVWVAIDQFRGSPSLDGDAQP